MTQNSGNDRRKCESENAGREMPAVRTTIVGGRPPGCGKDIGDIPRGIDVLIKKAAVDLEFRKLLLALRARAADEIGLILQAEEAALLEIVPASQLDMVISRTHVEPSKRPAFLGKAAAVMLVALGASGVQQTLADEPTAAIPPKETKNQLVAQAQPVAVGSRPPVRTNTQLPSDSSTQPSSQPSSQPALSPQQRADVDKLVEQLDSNDVKIRDEAHKKLKAMGQAVVPVLNEIASNRKLSEEVAARIKTIIDSFGPVAKAEKRDPVNFPDGEMVFPDGAGRPAIRLRVQGGDVQVVMPGVVKADEGNANPPQPKARLEVGSRPPPDTTTQPATRPATAPASQPTSRPATQPGELAPQQRAEVDKLIEQLDSDEFAKRDAAYNKLKEMGQIVVPVLKEIAANRKLSDEVSTRIKLVVESLNPPPVKVVRPARVLAQDGARIQRPDEDGNEGADEIQIKSLPLLQVAAGVRAPDKQPAELRKPPESATQPASGPATQPASQPASQPALTPKQRVEVDKLIEQLDSNEFAVRDAAYNKLKEMGQPVVPVLKEIAANRKLSEEVAIRIKLVIESLSPKPAKPARPTRVEAQNGLRAVPLVEDGNEGADTIQLNAQEPQQLTPEQQKEMEKRKILAELELKKRLEAAAQTSPPASAPASAPATQPALTKEQRTEVDNLIEQLDSNEFATRDAAHKKLKEMGKPVVPVLKEVIARKKVSQEVLARLQIIVESLSPTTRPVQIQAQRGVRVQGGAVAEPLPED